MASDASNNFDAIVIGSGQGGTPLCQALAGAGMRTALVEREHVGGTCINICIVGDFDQSAPTATQIRRTQLLVQSLQRRLRIPAKNVIAYDRPGSSTGLGRLFPAARLREALLP